MIPLLSIAYLPPVSWCAIAWKSEKVALEACDHYQKGSLRNRCFVAGPNGIQRLSIPLCKGKNQKAPIRDVRISYDEPWQRQHWRSIKTAYGNAPYFEHYEEDVIRFYEKPYTFLFDYNVDFLQFIFQKKFAWNGGFELTEDYHSPHQWPHGTDYRETIDADPEPHSADFQAQQYGQVFMEKTGFIPNLSILDVLFCCGKQGAQVLQNSHFPGF